MKKKTCTYCGEKLSAEEIQGPCRDKTGDVMCDRCYEDEYQFECCKCGDYEDNDYQGSIGSLIVVTDADQCDVPEGIYEVIKHPYFGDDYFHTWFWKDAIKRISESTFEIDTDPFPAGHLCRECTQQIRESIASPEGVQV